MLKDVLKEMAIRLNPGGKLMITQKERWAGPHRYPNFQFDNLAEGTGMKLVGDKSWRSADFPNYSHVITNPTGGATNVDPAVTFIFIKE